MQLFFLIRKLLISMSFSIASYKQEMHFRRETGNKNKHSVKKNNWNIELVANIPVYLLLRTNMLHKVHDKDRLGIEI